MQTNPSLGLPDVTISFSSFELHFNLVKFLASFNSLNCESGLRILITNFVVDYPDFTFREVLYPPKKSGSKPSVVPSIILADGGHLPELTFMQKMSRIVDMKFEGFRFIFEEKTTNSVIIGDAASVHMLSLGSAALIGMSGLLDHCIFTATESCEAGNAAPPVTIRNSIDDLLMIMRISGGAIRVLQQYPVDLGVGLHEMRTLSRSICGDTYDDEVLLRRFSSYQPAVRYMGNEMIIRVCFHLSGAMAIMIEMLGNDTLELSTSTFLKFYSLYNDVEDSATQTKILCSNIDPSGKMRSMAMKLNGSMKVSVFDKRCGSQTWSVDELANHQVLLMKEMYAFLGTVRRINGTEDAKKYMKMYLGSLDFILPESKEQFGNAFLNTCKLKISSPSAHVHGMLMNITKTVNNHGSFCDHELISGSVDEVYFHRCPERLLQWCFILQDISNCLPNSRFSHVKASSVLIMKVHKVYFNMLRSNSLVDSSTIMTNNVCMSMVKIAPLAKVSPTTKRVSKEYQMLFPDIDVKGFELTDGVLHDGCNATFLSFESFNISTMVSPQTLVKDFWVDLKESVNCELLSPTIITFSLKNLFVNYEMHGPVTSSVMVFKYVAIEQLRILVGNTDGTDISMKCNFTQFMTMSGLKISWNQFIEDENFPRRVNSKIKFNHDTMFVNLGTNVKVSCSNWSIVCVMAGVKYVREFIDGVTAIMSCIKVRTEALVCSLCTVLGDDCPEPLKADTAALLKLVAEATLCDVNNIDLRESVTSNPPPVKSSEFSVYAEHFIIELLLKDPDSTVKKPYEESKISLLIEFRDFLYGSKGILLNSIQQLFRQKNDDKTSFLEATDSTPFVSPAENITKSKKSDKPGRVRCGRWKVQHGMNVSFSSMGLKFSFSEHRTLANKTVSFVDMTNFSYKARQKCEYFSVESNESNHWLKIPEMQMMKITCKSFILTINPTVWFGEGIEALLLQKTIVKKLITEREINKSFNFIYSQPSSVELTNDEILIRQQDSEIASPFLVNVMFEEFKIDFLNQLEIPIFRVALDNFIISLDSSDVNAPNTIRTLDSRTFILDSNDLNDDVDNIGYAGITGGIFIVNIGAFSLLLPAHFANNSITNVPSEKGLLVVENIKTEGQLYAASVLEILTGGSVTRQISRNVDLIPLLPFEYKSKDFDYDGNFIAQNETVLEPKVWGVFVVGNDAPTKIYASMSFEISDLTVNVSDRANTLPTITELLEQTVPHVTLPSPDPLAPGMMWWDTVRFWCHGECSLAIKNFHVKYCVSGPLQMEAIISINLEDSIVNVSPQSFDIRFNNLVIAAQIKKNSRGTLFKRRHIPGRARGLKQFINENTDHPHLSHHESLFFKGEKRSGDFSEDQPVKLFQIETLVLSLIHKYASHSTIPLPGKRRRPDRSSMARWNASTFTHHDVYLHKYYPPSMYAVLGEVATEFPPGYDKFHYFRLAKEDLVWDLRIGCLQSSSPVQSNSMDSNDVNNQLNRVSPVVNVWLPLDILHNIDVCLKYKSSFEQSTDDTKAPVDNTQKNTTDVPRLSLLDLVYQLNLQIYIDSLSIATWFSSERLVGLAIDSKVIGFTASFHRGEQISQSLTVRPFVASELLGEIKTVNLHVRDWGLLSDNEQSILNLKKEISANIPGAHTVLSRDQIEILCKPLYRMAHIKSIIVSLTAGNEVTSAHVDAISLFKMFSDIACFNRTNILGHVCGQVLNAAKVQSENEATPAAPTPIAPFSTKTVDFSPLANDIPNVVIHPDIRKFEVNHKLFKPSYQFLPILTVAKLDPPSLSIDTFGDTMYASRSDGTHFRERAKLESKALEYVKSKTEGTNSKDSNIWGLRLVDLRLLWTIDIRDGLFEYVFRYLELFTKNNVSDKPETNVRSTKDAGDIQASADTKDISENPSVKVETRKNQHRFASANQQLSLEMFKDKSARMDINSNSGSARPRVRGSITDLQILENAAESKPDPKAQMSKLAQFTSLRRRKMVTDVVKGGRGLNRSGKTMFVSQPTLNTDLSAESENIANLSEVRRPFDSTSISIGDELTNQESHLQNNIPQQPSNDALDKTKSRFSLFGGIRSNLLKRASVAKKSVESKMEEALKPIKYERYFFIELIAPQVNCLDSKTHSSIIFCAGNSSLEGKRHTAATVSDAQSNLDGENSLDLTDVKVENMFQRHDLRFSMDGVSAYTLSTLESGEDIVHWKALAGVMNMEDQVDIDDDLVEDTGNLKMAIKDFHINAQYIFWIQYPAVDAMKCHVLHTHDPLVCNTMLDLPEICLDVESSQFYMVLDVLRNVLLAPPPTTGKSSTSSSEQSDIETGKLMQQLNRSNPLNNVMSELDVHTKASRDELNTLLSDFYQNNLLGEGSGSFEAVMLSRFVEFFIGKGVWIMRSEYGETLVEIGFTGVYGTHSFYENRNTSFGFEIQRFWILKYGTIFGTHQRKLLRADSEEKPTPANRRFLSPWRRAPEKENQWVLLPVLDEPEPCARCGVVFKIEENSSRACVFHADNYGVPGVYQAVSMDDPMCTVIDKNSKTDDVVSMWSCCGKTNKFALGCTARPHICKELMLSIRSQAIPTILVDSQVEVTVIPSLEISIFPGTSYFLQLELTRAFADVLHKYFNLGEQQAEPSSQPIAENNVMQSVKHVHQEAWYINYLRVGDISLKISTSGFPINVDNLMITVDSFVRRREVMDAKRLLWLLEMHAVWFVTSNMASSSIDRVRKLISTPFTIVTNPEDLHNDSRVISLDDGENMNHAADKHQGSSRSRNRGLSEDVKAGMLLGANYRKKSIISKEND